MKKILLILFCFIGLLSKAQMNTSWFNSYPNATVPIINSIYAEINGNILDVYAELITDGGSDLTEFGTLFGTSPSLTYGSASSWIGDWDTYGGITVMRSVKFNPSTIPDGTYYFRPYAINSAGIGYGEYLTYIVQSTHIEAPTVIISSISSITGNSANVNSSITNIGNSSIIAYGIRYRRSDIGQLTTVTLSGSATNYTVILSDLTPNSTYYVQAFATNSAGNGYSDFSTFNTSGGSGTPPTVTTSSITDITASSATGGGNVTSQGSAMVTQRGIQWSATSDFATILGSTMDGAGLGGYSSSITGLNCGNLYYTRAYALNSVGYGYGSVVNFITSVVPPSVTTFYSSDVTSSSFTLYAGNISICSGYHSITSHTIVFSPNSDFSSSQYINISSSSTADYSMSYSNGGGLIILPNTTYYYRAMIIVNSTQYYGNTLILTTLP